MHLSINYGTRYQYSLSTIPLALTKCWQTGKHYAAHLSLTSRKYRCHNTQQQQQKCWQTDISSTTPTRPIQAVSRPKKNSHAVLLNPISLFRVVVQEVHEPLAVELGGDAGHLLAVVGESLPERLGVLAGVVLLHAVEPADQSANRGARPGRKQRQRDEQNSGDGGFRHVGTRGDVGLFWAELAGTTYVKGCSFCDQRPRSHLCRTVLGSLFRSLKLSLCTKRDLVLHLCACGCASVRGAVRRSHQRKEARDMGRKRAWHGGQLGTDLSPTIRPFAASEVPENIPFSKKNKIHLSTRRHLPHLQNVDDAHEVDVLSRGTVHLGRHPPVRPVTQACSRRRRRRFHRSRGTIISIRSVACLSPVRGRGGRGRGYSIDEVMQKAGSP